MLRLHYGNEQNQKATQLKVAIDTTATIIDTLVYELYGLTMLKLLHNKHPFR